jgi:hypothetical protein
MTSEPLPAQCAEAQRRLAEGESAPELLDHLAGCETCSLFSAALVELEARLARLPQPEPPPGALDRAIVRFRAEVGAHGSAGTTPQSAPPLVPPMRPGGPPPSLPPSPSAGTGPPSQAPPGRPRRAGHARRRQWHPRVTLAAGVAAVIALVVVLVTVLGPGSTPPAYAAILHQAAANTAAEKSYRYDLSGSIGFTIRGQNVTAVVTGTGASEGPNKSELSQEATLSGTPLLQQDIVTVGNSAWTRTGHGQWAQVPIPPDHASPLDRALNNPSEGLNALATAGSGYRSLGTTTVDGTPVRRIELTIPGSAFNPFGNLPEHAGKWTVVVYVSQQGLILRRIDVKGSGVVSLLGNRLPFAYFLRLTLSHFGVKVSIQPPPGFGSAASPSATATRTSPSSRPTTTPSASPGPSGASPHPTQTPSPKPTTSTPRPTCTPTSPAAPKPAAVVSPTKAPCVYGQQIS